MVFVIGWKTGTALEREKTADLRASLAIQYAETIATLQNEIQLANKESDRLSAALQQASKHKEIRYVSQVKQIPSKTTGQLCLTPDAVSLLNSNTPDTNPSLPASVSSPASAPATFAASDRDVALWIAEAQSVCGKNADTLNALIDWTTR